MRHSCFIDITLIVVLACFATVVSTGCKKSHNSPAYDFSVSGDLVVWSPTKFRFNGPSADVSVWDFGDGSYSTDSVAVHVYSAVGTYNVTLVTKPATGNSINTNTITKKITVIAPMLEYAQRYTHLMDEPRNWHGYYTASEFGQFLYGETISSSGYAIGIINDTVVTMASLQLSYYSVDTILKTISFHGLDSVKGTNRREGWLAYYYSGDSLNFHLAEKIFAGGNTDYSEYIYSP